VAKKKKVLVVEDEKDICVLLEARLKQNNFSVDIANDGYAVLAYIKAARPPDAIILDLVLPQRSGVDLLCSLKSKWPDTKIFIFTAHPKYIASRHLFEEYINGFFCKTDGITKLVSVIITQLKLC